MFYRLYTLRLGSPANAKLAAAFFTEKLEQDGDSLPLVSAEVMMDSDGSLILKFGCETMPNVRRMEKYGDAALDELRKSIPCKSEKFSTISVFRYDRKHVEAV